MMFGSEHKSAIATEAGVTLPLEDPAGMVPLQLRRDCDLRKEAGSAVRLTGLQGVDTGLLW